MKTAVIGAGSWGTAFAALVARHGATLWSRRAEQVKAMQQERHNPDYLTEVRLPDELVVTDSLERALAGATVVAVAVPSHGFRDVLRQAAPFVPPDVPLISLTKGVEEGTLERMTQVAADVLGRPEGRNLGALTGPNLAGEIGAGQPAAAVLAMAEAGMAESLQTAFMTERFRVYTNRDVVGCEIAGAAKNVMAIAAGIAAGLGYGANTRAALITRALAEITRLGVACGGDRHTFAGLAGVGDLIVTCTSAQSRNHRVGMELGRGRALPDIVADLGMVAEGVRTTRSVLQLASRLGVDMPIATRVAAVLYEGRNPAEVVPELMLRAAKQEGYGLD